MRWIIRAPTWAELEDLRTRVVACFQYVGISFPSLQRSDRRHSCSRAAALATSCKETITFGQGYYDVRENPVLGMYLTYRTRVSPRVGLHVLIKQKITGEEYCKMARRFGLNTHVSEQTIPASTDFVSCHTLVPGSESVTKVKKKPNRAILLIVSTIQRPTLLCSEDAKQMNFWWCEF